MTSEFIELVDADVQGMIDAYVELEKHQGRSGDLSDPSQYIMIHSGAMAKIAEFPLAEGKSVPPLLLIQNKEGYQLFSVIALFKGMDDDTRKKKLKDFLLEHGADMYVLMSEGSMRLSADLSKPQQAVLLLQAEQRGGLFALGTLNIEGTEERSIDFANSFGPVIGKQDAIEEKSLLNYTRTLN